MERCDDVTTTPSGVSDSPCAGDRGVGALAHLCIPLWGPVLPLIVREVTAQPFRKEHARQALPFQLCFFALWVVLVVLAVALKVVPVTALPIVALLGFLAELPQVIRALAGKPPYQLR